MTTELNDKIKQWENDAVYNTRQVKVAKRLSNGEYILLLIEGAKVDLEGNIMTVEVRKLFQTMGQSADNRSRLSGDLYTFDKLASIVAESYLNKASEVITQWMGDNFSE